MIASSALAFGQVVLIDVALAGDNAVVIGAMVASLPVSQRRSALLFGIAMAVVLRVVMSFGLVWLMHIPLFLWIGSFTLLWVAWKMWKDIRSQDDAPGAAPKPAESLPSAIIGITLADVSMSLDNVLGVAGAARGHGEALIFGLVLSMTLMGVGANLVAKLIGRYRWIAYFGLGMILFVAVKMWVDGYIDLL